MNNTATWLICSALALLLFGGVYRLLIARITLLKAGRYYLLFTMLMALAIPLPWQNFITETKEIAFIATLEIPDIVSATGISNGSLGFDRIRLLAIAYIIPAISLFLFFLFSNVKMLLALRKQKISIAGNSKIVVTDRDTLPFSWFGRIVVSRSDFNSQHFTNILAHERTHVRQYHFVDLLLAELITIIQWFNPAAWAYRRYIRDVQEYLADRGAISKQQDIPGYLRLLTRLSGAAPAGVLGNNMNHSIIKNRLIMMTKTNKRKLEQTRMISAMLAAVLIGLMVFTISCQSQKEQENILTEEAIPEKSETAVVQEKAVPPNDEIFTVVEEMPSYPGGDEARIKFIVGNIKYPEEAKKRGIQGRVFVTFVVETDGSVTGVKILRGIGGGCDEEAVRVIEAMPKWNPGKQRGEAVRVQFNIPIKFALS